MRQALIALRNLMARQSEVTGRRHLNCIGVIHSGMMALDHFLSMKPVNRLERLTQFAELGASMPVERGHKAKQDFTYAEYAEASKAYFHGVGIGYTVFQQYVAGNALLGALVGALQASTGVIVTV